MKLIALTLLVILSFILPDAAHSNCSIRTLKNVCDICEERALEKLGTDSASNGQCPEIKCPEPSLACVRLDSFKPFLKGSYTLVAMVWQDLPDVVFKIDISERAPTPNTFFYDVRNQNFKMALKDSVGFILYDVVNFNLPFGSGEKTYSYNCIGSINNDSAIEGVCSTVATDEEGNSLTYGWPFIAHPSDNPLQ